jgi:16S rRNA (adenine1518-N6/adenine1519-N6)-dimethyltransferase
MSEASAFPETAAGLREALRARGLAPSKRFGQHFLVEPKLLDAIAAEARLTPADVVLEVGPGTGALTRRLVEAAGAVVAVEIDAGFAALIAERFRGEGRLELVHTDVMETKTRLAPAVVSALGSARARIAGSSLKVVANLPYNVTTPFLSSLLTGFEVPASMVLLVQKELAQGITASPGTKDYSPLNLLLKLLGRTSIARTVAPEVFWPRPQVQSAVVTFVRTALDVAPALSAYPLARHLFGERRKAVAALMRKLPAELGGPLDAATIARALAIARLDGRERAEALEPQTFLDLRAAVDRETRRAV